MNDSIEQLAKLFSRFPGIGERQSKRFVYFLLRQPESYIRELLASMTELRKRIRICESCFRHFESTKDSLCDICRNPKTDSSLLMVVEKDADFESIRRSGTYKGKYFILGGLVPIVEKSTPNNVRIEELKDTIESRAKDTILKEVIIALALTPHADHTDTYLKSELDKLKETYGFKISSLGRGLSTGTELEYSDNDTIKNAFKNRQ